MTNPASLRGLCALWTAGVLVLAQSCAHRVDSALTKLEDAASLKAAAETAKSAQDWKTARTLYERLVRFEPNEHEHWYWLGVASLNIDDPNNAQQALAQSIALKDTPKAEYNLAIALENMGDYQKAVEHLRRALALSPDYGLAWRRLALSQTQLGNWTEAGEAALRAKELRADDHSVNELIAGINRMLRTSRTPPEALELFNAGREAARRGDLPTAVREYGSSLKKSPSFAECRTKLADALRRLGQLNEAEAEYRAAIASYQKIEILDLADSENNLANVLVEKSDKSDEGEKLVRHSIAIRGERPTYLDTLGRTCELRHQLDCAREAYSKLVQKPTGISKAMLDHATQRLAELRQSR